MKTKQETFETVVNHLLQQNAKSTSMLGDCRYRGETGNKVLKCAVGCLIADEHYNPDFDRMSNADENFNKYIIPVVKESGYYSEAMFLRTLQDVHDSNEPEVWRQKLELVASELGVHMPD